MRRRMWTYIETADVMFSFQVGLRSMIEPADMTSNLPRNIDDDDVGFHEHVKELPVPLSPSRITAISFMITKATLAADFARLLKETSQPEKVPYERVLEIDKEIRQHYDSIPEHYKLRPLSSIDLSPIQLVVARFMLANLHHKSICVLHSRYLGMARSDYRYLYSRRSCLESAMQLLNFQAIQHEQSIATQGGHNLNGHQTSLVTHDFLLAAAIISVELSLNQGRSPFEGRSDTGPSRKDLVAALDRSVDIWVHLRDRSVEAYKAADVLAMLLDRIRRQGEPRAFGPLDIGHHRSHLDVQSAESGFSDGIRQDRQSNTLILRHQQRQPNQTEHSNCTANCPSSLSFEDPHVDSTCWLGNTNPPSLVTGAARNDPWTENSYSFQTEVASTQAANQNWQSDLLVGPDPQPLLISRTLNSLTI